MADLFEHAGAAGGAPAKRPALHSDTSLYAAVADLAIFIGRATVNMRRDIKPTYVRWLVKESIRMDLLLREANRARGDAKLPFFDEILLQVEGIEFTFRVLLANGWMKRKTFESSMPLTVSVAAQTHKLRNYFAPVSQ